MRLRIIIERRPIPGEATELPLFNSIMTARRPAAGPLLGSLTFHLFAMLVISSVAQYWTWYHEDDVDWSRYRVEPIRLHLAEPIYFSPPARERVPQAVPQHAKAAKSAAPSTAPAVSQRVQFPALRASSKNLPVILQPEALPQTTPPPAALPPLAYWARQASNSTKPTPREVITPGRTEVPSPAARPGGPPVAALSNREAALADVNISMSQPRTEVKPRLSVSNTGTVPVRLLAVTEPHAASFESLAGQPVNIIALASEPRRSQIVEVPRGLQNAPTSAAHDGGPSPAPRDQSLSEADTEPRQGGRSGAVSNAQARGTHDSTRAENASAGPSSASSRGMNTSLDRVRPVNGLPSRSSTSAQLQSVEPVIQIQHPANGSFDVVIMQSQAHEDAPDLAGMLTGNPVYSVYLPVGDRKEWLLEYCVPSRESKQANSYQINVDDMGSLIPPYPISTIIPEGFRNQQISKQIVLHGLLTAAGDLHLAKADVTGLPLLSQLMALVSRWQFRPARRNNKAIDVEVLVVIPPRA